MKTFLLIHLLFLLNINNEIDNTYWIEKNIKWDKEKFCINNKNYINEVSFGSVIYFKDSKYLLVSGFISKNPEIHDSLCIDIAGGGVIYKGNYNDYNEIINGTSKLLFSNIFYNINSSKLDSICYDKFLYLKKANELVLNDTLVFIPLKEAIFSECNFIFNLIMN